MNGRKRHLLVDTQGFLLRVGVHPASVQDRDGAKQVLRPDLRERYPRLAKIWADGSYGGQLVDWVYETLGCVLEIVPRPADQHRFVVLPKRWIVERTFGWIGRYRRMSKDYEYTTSSSEAMVTLGMIRVLLKRLAKQTHREKRQKAAA